MLDYLELSVGAMCLAIVVGCQAGDVLERDALQESRVGERADVGTASAGCSTGAPGSFSYCTAECPCEVDEGDCDSDAECAAGLRCAKNIGAEYGWDSDVDVCVPECSPAGKNPWDVCSAECPCTDGVGDCDGDDECAPDHFCLLNAGPAYGYSDPSFDVCVSGCPEAGNGAWNYCTDACPCDEGEGDCDRDDECAPGLECLHDVGDQYGFDPEIDVCSAGASGPICGDGTLDPGEQCDDGNTVDGDGCDSDCMASPGCAATGTTWSQGFGDSNSQWGDVRVAAAPCGDIVMAGSLQSTTDFGTGALSSAGSSDVYVARFDSDGNNLWARRFGGAGYQSAKALAVSHSGAIAIAGVLGATDFGDGDPGGDVAIAVFDGNGQYLWSRVATGARGTAVAFDDAGNAYLAGTCRSAIDLGGGPLPCGGETELFLAAFDGAGNHLWSRAYLGPEGEKGNAGGIGGMEIAPSGDIFVSGSFSVLDLGGGRITSNGRRGAFVARLDGTGGHVWTKAVTQGELSGAGDLALTPAGDVVVTGSVDTTPDFFGTGPLTTHGSDIFVTAFDPAGGHLWTRHFTDTSGLGDQSGQGIAVSPTGDIFVTGWYWGTVDFGGGPQPSQAQWDIFLLTLDSAGGYLSSQIVGAPEFQQGIDVMADSAGNRIAVGMFNNTIDFGSGPLVSAGAYDIYLVKQSP